MSVDKQSNEADASPSAHMPRREPLTIANLSRHERATATISANNAVRGWLAGSGHSRQNDSNPETWMQLVARDSLAAAIEATMQDERRR
jgi:hypothetical protein